MDGEIELIFLLFFLNLFEIIIKEKEKGDILSLSYPRKRKQAFFGTFKKRFAIKYLSQMWYNGDPLMRGTPCHLKRI